MPLLKPIVTGAKIKGVVCFCINDNPVRTNPFSVEVSHGNEMDVSIIDLLYD